MEQRIFTKDFPVRYHELDSCGNLRVATLLNYLQDTAGMHATTLGVAMADLRKLGLTWVLSRIHLVAARYPRAGETVTVRTWPATRQEIFTCREFELYDDHGACVARATSSWAVVNVATRRPVRLEGNLPPYPLTPQRAVDDDFSPLPPFPEAATTEMGFRVLRSDLDMNHHVNNTIYAGWALEAVPDAVASDSLQELEIVFRAEARRGDNVVSRCAIAETGPPTCCLHQITNREDGKELARLRTRWKNERI
ncbi:acyl-[acyl-carrier-protein] thioesterase [Geobacter sp. AOG2]|uniref:acyl-[acyl-carrier-protein] thioesterase n=1 Tax=Geobacter sp. AOG2 TaxID=1566347 RepID=UPI001CC6E08E|nr:acyl-ACP thioesterase domain-containing protein [Geobacter sp. AOG2]GFE62177.1 acyl-ACP thioesterase [Geobacter sp. AOG2]